MILNCLTRSWRALVPRIKPNLVTTREKSKKAKESTTEARIRSLIDRPPCWHRPASICEVCYPTPPCALPCFNIKEVRIVQADIWQADTVRDFLNVFYWPREPAINGLYMPLACDYINTLNDRYTFLGDRFMAYENGERLIGVCIGYKYVPYAPRDFEVWARVDPYGSPEKHHKYFMQHCLSQANLFEKYHAAFIYDISVIATADDVQGQGVARLLLEYALEASKVAGYPVTQIIATSAYLQRACSRLKNVVPYWSMPYSAYLNARGDPVFSVRRPHTSVVVYARPFTKKLALEKPCLPPL